MGSEKYIDKRLCVLADFSLKIFRVELSFI